MAVIKVFDRGVAVGDILFLDSSSPKKKLFLRASEVPQSANLTQKLNGVSISYTAPYTAVGVVFHVDGRKVYVINKTSGGSLKYKTSNTADGQSSDWYYRKDGSMANNRGIMNVARGVAYWGSNGRTPSTNETIPASNNSDPVNRTAFETSAYCKLLRQTYASYESYISEGMGVKFPQEAGCFGLPNGKTITYTYNDANHPAFQHCAGVNYGVDGIGAGDWYLPGVYEGTALMRDAVLEKVNASMALISGASISNGSYRWFAQRFISEDAWSFGGNGGNLHYSTCTYEFTVQAVVLLEV